MVLIFNISWFIWPLMFVVVLFALVIQKIKFHLLCHQSSENNIFFKGKIHFYLVQIYSSRKRDRERKKNIDGHFKLIDRKLLTEEWSKRRNFPAKKCGMSYPKVPYRWNTFENYWNYILYFLLLLEKKYVRMGKKGHCP